MLSVMICYMWVIGGLQEAMVEQYNDQLRELRQKDMSEASTAFRETIRELRDEERAPQEAVQVSFFWRFVLAEDSY